MSHLENGADKLIVTGVTPEQLTAALGTAGISGFRVEAIPTAEAGENSSRHALAGLKPEQYKRAEVAIAAMAEKFGRDPEEFSVVLVEMQDGQKQAVAALTSPSGIYKGSYDNMMSSKNTDDFMIEIGDQEVDTRQAMTWEVYEAIIEDQKTKGTESLPDGLPLPRTSTWLTGETSGESRSYYLGCVGDRSGQPDRLWTNQARDDENMRFRPAVVL
jgi:hypothetical protein